MERRDFLKTGGIAAIALTGACGPAESAKAGESAAAAPAAAANHSLTMRFVGLNGIINGPNRVDAACLNPKDLTIPDAMGEKFPEHIPHLVVATANLKDPATGEAVNQGELNRWRLRTATKEFRKWKVSKVTVKNLKTSKVDVFLSGIVPLGRINPTGTVSQWMSKGVVAAVVPIDGGVVSDDVPRVLLVGPMKDRNAAGFFWKITAKKWGDSNDVPRRLTDVVRWECEATSAIEFETDATKIVTNGGAVEAYIINVPTRHSPAEEGRPSELMHVLAGYQLFDTAPAELPIPKTDPKNYAGMALRTEPIGTDPVYCPPFEI